MEKKRAIILKHKPKDGFKAAVSDIALQIYATI